MAIAAGGSHNCAIRAYGGVQCWGNNANNRATLPSDFTAARTDPDVVWLAEKTEAIAPPSFPPSIQAYTAYQLIPEGEAAVISFEPSTITVGESVTLDLRIEGDGASQASLSPNFITLSSTTPKAQVTVTVAENSDKQGSAVTFMIAAALRPGGTPVSYTHLTLPTNREV